MQTHTHTHKHTQTHTQRETERHTQSPDVSKSPDSFKALVVYSPVLSLSLSLSLALSLSHSLSHSLSRGRKTALQPQHYKLHSGKTGQRSSIVLAGYTPGGDQEPVACSIKPIPGSKPSLAQHLYQFTRHWDNCIVDDVVSENVR